MTMVSSGGFAMEKLTLAVSMNDPFALVITDYKLPDMNSFELSQRIRKEGACCDCPIILLASMGRVGDGKACRKIGIDGYFTRPIRREDLKIAMETVVGRGKNREARDLITRHTLAEVRGRKVAIFVADDYPINRTVVATPLRNAGYSVDFAVNGLLAVEAFRKKHYDLILMDIQMPEMDGFHAASQIRQIEAKRHGKNKAEGRPWDGGVPIVAITANTLMGNRQGFVRAGMNDLITKPFTRMEILEVAEKWIGSEVGSRGFVYDNHGKKAESGDRSRAGPEQEGEVSPVDWDRALSEFMGKRELLMEVLAYFENSLGEKLKKMFHALGDGEFDVILTEAHTIKGGAANIAAERISEIALELEKAHLRGAPYEYVMLDIAMPVMDGKEVLKRLGISEIKQQVELLGNRNLYDSIGGRFARIVDGLWTHSLACANAAAVAAWMIDVTLEADPFLLGLTHDIGKLVLLSIVDKKEKTGAWGRDVEGESIYRLLSEYHPRFGATLLERWKFPKTYITTVLYLEKPDEAESLTKELTLINFSNALAESLEVDSPPGDPEELSFLKSAILMGLTPEMIAGIREETARRVEALKTIFGNLRQAG